MELSKAIQIAKQARQYACADAYTVGTCLVTKFGTYYSGCNIENAGIQSICAERTAFVKALSEGEREFDYLVVVGGKKETTLLEECFPCGYCRQFISQYTKPDFKIYTYNDVKDTIQKYTISELLPHAFGYQKED